MPFLFGNAPGVMLMSLLLLASAQRTSNNLHKDLGEYPKSLFYTLPDTSRVSFSMAPTEI